MTATTANPRRAEAADGPTSVRREDFVSAEAARWCAGCGDYSVLAQLQRVLAEVGEPPERYAMVSGIGCSGRLPYYLNTNGFHSIHGRAPAVATGIKAVRPDVTVWVFTGDGDALSIGGNHLIHSMRRNADIKVLLMNNRIYGLTKGQVSPTSEAGKVTKSTPGGSVDQPVDPVLIALAAGATFVARSTSADGGHLRAVLKRAAHHHGSAFIEVLQNCAIFNDGAWDDILAQDVREDRVVRLTHGQPMIFGKDRDKGISLEGLSPQVVALDSPTTARNLLIHDDNDPAGVAAFVLAAMGFPDFPVPMGVFRDIERPVHHDLLRSAVPTPSDPVNRGALLEGILRGSDTWSLQRE